MRKIKEMSEVSIPKGYEKESGREVCDDHYNEQVRRNRKITGGNTDLGMFDAEGQGEIPEGGFIPRNNVRERL
jgi:hypothetical protein